MHFELRYLSSENVELVMVIFFQLFHLFGVINCSPILVSYNVFCLARYGLLIRNKKMQKIESLLDKFKYVIIIPMIAILYGITPTFHIFESIQSFLILIIACLDNSALTQLIIDAENLNKNQPKELPIPRQRRNTRDEDEKKVLELIEQGYFLYRQVNIAPFSSLALTFINRKGKEIADYLECENEDIAEHLGDSEDPKKTLCDFINLQLTDEIPIGSVEKILLIPRKSMLQENNISESVPFQFFKAGIWKLSKSDVLVIIDDRSNKKTLSLIESLKHAIVCTLSHELKTLANGITGNIELMSDDPHLEKEQRLHHGIALCSSYLLSSRLNDLFDYIQIQNKAFKLHFSEFSLDEFIIDLKKTGVSYASQRQIQFVITKGPKLPRKIVGDRPRILQVLMNLISKAVEFTDYGKVELLIKQNKQSKIVFKVVSYGSCMGAKLDQQVKKLSPSSRKLYKNSSGEQMDVQVVNNLEALSLEISQILCQEMGTHITVKHINEKQSAIKFVINDGFLPHKPSPHDNRKLFRRSKTNLAGMKFRKNKNSDEKQSKEENETKISTETTRKISWSINIKKSTRIQDITKATEMNGGESARNDRMSLNLERNRSTFAAEAQQILKIFTQNDTNEQSTVVEEIPNEIAATSPIALPIARSKTLIESLETHPVKSATHRPLDMPKNLLNEGLTKNLINRENDTPKFAITKPTRPKIIEKPAKLLMQPSFRNGKLRRVSLLESAEKHALRVMHATVDDVDRCSILIVDDDAINRWVLKSLLRKSGYTSIEAKDGNEAVTLIEGYIKTNKLYELNLIFMDLQMPVLDGMEATRKILNICDEAFVAAPTIVGLTADPIEADRQNFMKAGLKEIFMKPVDLRKVEYIINKYIRRVC